MLPAPVAVKVPAPEKGVVAGRTKVLVVVPCVQFPVRVSSPFIVTVPVLLFVKVTPVLIVTAPPNVIPPEPAKLVVVVNVDVPVPVVMTPAILFVSIPAKFRAAFPAFEYVEPDARVRPFVNVSAPAPALEKVPPLLTVTNPV